MKKIMFNDKYGLTDAVLKGNKTMTRRIAYDGEIKDIHTGYMSEGVDAGRLALCDGNMIVAKSKYKLSEVVAVAQSYNNAGKEAEFETHDEALAIILLGKQRGKGWSNKMFVSADLMPHQIRITDIKVERLQDISDEDCMEEGVMWDYFDYPIMSHKVYLINDHEAFSTPRQAFAALIDKVSGKGTWERNPYVFAYTFELVK